MKRECPQCGFELREMSWHEKYVLENLERMEWTQAPNTYEGLDIWLEEKVGATHYCAGLGADVTLVEAKTDYYFEDESTMIYIVLKIGEHSHFIAKGTRDSYGNASWDSMEFREVTKQTRTTWIWQENA